MQRTGEAAGGAPGHDPVRETVHDLRNLFAVVASIRHLLDQDDKDGCPARRTLLHGLEEAAVRGRELTSRLLARQACGEPLLVDMGEQVANAAPLLNAVVKHPASLEIDTQMALPFARVSADPAELEAIMLELVANASRAGARHIALRCRRIGDWIWLIVADDGSGLGVGDAAKSPIEASSSGHGLQRVRRAIRDMKGKFFIRGSVGAGAGTVVAMLLPVAHPAASKSRARHWSASPTNEESCDEDRWTVAA